MTDGEAEDEIQFLRTVSTVCVCVCDAAVLMLRESPASVRFSALELLNVGVRKPIARYERL